MSATHSSSSFIHTKGTSSVLFLFFVAAVSPPSDCILCGIVSYPTAIGFTLRSLPNFCSVGVTSHRVDMTPQVILDRGIATDSPVAASFAWLWPRSPCIGPQKVGASTSVCVISVSFLRACSHQEYMASFPVPSRVSTTHKLVEHQIPHEGLANLPPASRDLRPCTFGPLAVASFTGTRNEWAGAV